MRTIEQEASQIKIITPDSDEKKVIFIEFLTFNIYFRLRFGLANAINGY